MPSTSACTGSVGGNTGGVTGPGSPYRLREGRSANSPKRRVEGRLEPQRRLSRSHQAQATDPRCLLYRAPPGRGDSFGEGQSHPHGPCPIQRVEGDEGVRAGSRNSPTGSLPLQATVLVRSGEHHQAQPIFSRTPAVVSEAGVSSSAPTTSAAQTWERFTAVGEGRQSVGAAAIEAPRFAGSAPSRIRLPQTTCTRYAP